VAKKRVAAAKVAVNDRRQNPEASRTADAVYPAATPNVSPVVRLK
jgi:hypothetical protein